MTNPAAHHQKVLNTAENLLKRFKQGKLVNRNVTFGQTSRWRLGKKRVIQYLQIGEETGDLELRIEVFVAKRGEG